MEWQVLDTGSASAEKNMALDDELLRGISSKQQPILHLYDWEGNCATYGYFLDPYTLLHEDAVEKGHLYLAKRPTGGGLVFHLTDFAYSILIPAAHVGYSVNTLENYAFINRMIVNVVQKFLGAKKSPALYSQESTSLAGHFCMAKPTKYDVMVEGCKVGGAAQRRTKHGFLHQGTISIALPPENILKPLLKNCSVWEAMKQNTYSFLSAHASRKSVNTVRQKLRELLIKETQRPDRSVLV